MTMTVLKMMKLQRDDIKEWDFAEDKILINYVFKLKEIDSSNISTLLDVKRSEVREVTLEFKRSSGAVHEHWNRIVLPFLEPHLEKLSSSKHLKKHVLEIAKSRFEKTTHLKGYSDEDIEFIVKQVKLKGDVPKTWVFIGNKVGKKNPEVVKKFYYNHIKSLA